MNRDWSLALRGEGVPSLTAPLTFCHGFVGTPLSFREPHLKSSAITFLAGLSSSKLLLLKQTHTANVLLLNGAEKIAHQGESLSAIFDQYPGSREVFLTRTEADAIIFPARDSALHGSVIGVRTADCLPLIIECGDWLALVHAGWRGLAAGIIERTLALIVDLAASGGKTAIADLRAAIGPSISGPAYEVGREVVDAVAGWEIATRSLNRSDTIQTASVNPSERWLLDLSEVAQRRIRGLYRNATISPSGICTFANESWHSFRRDKQNMGSNLAWVAIGG